MKIKTIIAAFVAAFTMTTANAADSKNATPIVNPSDIAQKEFIYYEGNNTIKFVYNLDAQGRVSSKVRYTLDNIGKWQPTMAYSVFYGDKETIVTCAGWSMDSRAFNKNAKQIHLDAEKYPVAINMPR